MDEARLTIGSLTKVIGSHEHCRQHLGKVGRIVTDTSYKGYRFQIDGMYLPKSSTLCWFRESDVELVVRHDRPAARDAMAPRSGSDSMCTFEIEEVGETPRESVRRAIQGLLDDTGKPKAASTSDSTITLTAPWSSSDKNPSFTAGTASLCPTDVHFDGQWVIVTESGIGKLQFYMYHSKDDALGLFNSLYNCRILYNPEGDEDSAKGLNPLALKSIRSWWTRYHYPSFHGADSSEVDAASNGEEAPPSRSGSFLSAIRSRLSTASNGEAPPSSSASFPVQLRHASGESSDEWVVVATKKGSGDAEYHKFSDEQAAQSFFNRQASVCALFDPGGDELCSGGLQPAPLPAERNWWLVATEEGVGKVKFYRFVRHETAEDFFNGLRMYTSRVLVDPKGAEVGAGGMNRLALKTIRTAIQQQLQTAPSERHPDG